MSVNYSTSKTPSEKPPTKIDGYNSQAAPVRPPQAAQFNKGATDIREVQDATDQRREHSNALSNSGRKGFEKQARFS
jgi:hypothetical protein